MWMTSCTGSARAEDLGDFEKVSWVELRPASGEDVWLSLARVGLGQVSHEMGCRWKSQDRKNVYLSPYVEEPLNSKVIKSFVPEMRSRYVFFEFRDSYVLSIYIYICTFHISVSGYGTDLVESNSLAQILVCFFSHFFYCCFTVCPKVDIALSVCPNQFFFDLFYVFFESLTSCNFAILNAVESSSSFFSWHIESVCVISLV